MAETGGDGAGTQRQSAAELLPAVYAELRRLADALVGRLPLGQTLQPTALVHEAYLRLVRDRDPGWNGCHHFIGAAARAMREILVDEARWKRALVRSLVPMGSLVGRQPMPAPGGGGTTRRRGRRRRLRSTLEPRMTARGR